MSVERKKGVKRRLLLVLGWLALSGFLTACGCVAWLVWADRHPHIGTYESRRSPEELDVEVRVYTGLRIEVEWGRPRELYGDDSSIEAVCDRWVGWPVHGVRLTNESSWNRSSLEL